MKQRNGLYMLLLSHFAILSGCIVVAPNREPHLRTQFEDIRPHLETLKTGGIKIGNFSVLSVDIKYNHLLVGARDNALLVDLGNINSVESWNLTTQSLGCDKGQDPSCHNYVKLMLPFEERIFICLTRGCIWRNRTNLNAAPGRDSNQNVFIADENYYSTPSQNDTGVITENGRVFRGTINLASRISMIHGKSFKPRISEVSTDFMSESDFYSDVHFVKSFIIGKYVYIFFRERTMECMSCGKYKVSRVARICKGDYAGQSTLRKYFITYQKAKLVCSDGGEYPVYFNEIQDVWWDSETNLFHAIFTSHPNGPPSSAICVYNLTDVNNVFYTSLFDSREAGSGKWVTVENKFKEYFDGCKVNEKYLISNPRPVPDGMMGTKNMVYNVYKDLSHDPLMHDPVLPTSLDSVQKQGNKAWFVKDGIRMTAIVLDKVGEHTVVYTSTDRGSVLKISQVAGSRQPCLLTEIDLFPINRQEVIKAMTIDPKQHILYFGSDTALTKLRLEQCGSHTHRRSCISASDPYCAWNKETRRCVSVLSSRDSNKLRKGSSTCPKTTEQIAWSPWKTCEGRDGNLCRCRFRPCQDRQNSSCQGGYELRFENCTVNVIVGSEREEWEKYGVQHGNWSAWDTWTDCETKPWVGVRKRTRNCTNPVPRRGGRPCVGEAVQYESCNLGKHAVSGRRTDSEETERSKFVSGLAIGLPVGLVVIILVVLGIYCVKRKQKEEPSSYSVPKTPERSPKSDCHYSPMNGVSTRGRPSSESQSKENNRNTRKNTCLEFKGFILCRTERAPSESV
ncbi:semaphorin-5A isoform X3 [Pocillopora verrucosa]|uniref:semaphorin-5A isoform X3 n=1 Tax=Pocillopora verrucosa TaxID=203993 RepID=UPI00333FC130